MSRIPPAMTSGSSSNFQTIFGAALKRYREKTKKDLVTHPLTAQLQTCESPSAVLDMLNKQHNIQGFVQSQSDDAGSKQWLIATVTVLCAFSGALGEGVGLVFSPAKVIFAGISVLLTAAKDVGTSKDVLVDLFGRIETFFKRIETYTEVPPTEAMTDLIIKIMVEVLGILTVATREMKQGTAKKYLKRLAGRTDIEDALQRLDKLTHEEAVMATAQVLKLAHSVDDKVTGIGNQVNEVIDVGRETRGVVHRIENDLGVTRRDQLREKFRGWLSPADPSVNYNTARDAYYNGTAAWFTQGNIFEQWKASGSESLLWVHGKPGSGKSILTSAIIHDIRGDSNSGASQVAYFFFDFKDAAKQDTRALLSSFLIQLCDQSDSCFKHLLDMYSTHNRGTQQPNEGALSDCLKNMLRNSGQVPIYLVVDALDECPNTSKTLGAPLSRQRVFEAVKELVELRLPKLHVCVTSRPEFDIRVALNQLAHFKVSLHDQDGQKQDIAKYVSSVVNSNSEPIMKKWKTEDKELVIKTLSRKADGMFRWVVCQLETLRHCFTRNIPRVLSDLPKSLDETYDRVLREINEANKEDAYRLLQCLTAAVRPLRVEELAEVLAIEFDGDDEIPKLNPEWRWEDQEEALQAACSSLISIVNIDGSRVVQFSHFSVREFLTSRRLSESRGDVSCYYISLGPAHTVLAQACLGTLLRLDHRVSRSTVGVYSTLARYAARYWFNHAPFGKASSRVQKGMEQLFDPDKPHFSAWLRLHDIDTSPSLDSTFYMFTLSKKSDAPPLYYSALCGLRNLTEHLIIKHPEQVNAHGGYHVAPIVAALARKHFQIAHLLHQHGADVDVRGKRNRTPLYSVSYKDYPDMVQWLLDHGADVNTHVDFLSWTPVFPATNLGHVEVTRILIQHNANIHAPDDEGRLPFHLAAQYGRLDVVRLLLGHGVDVNARDNDRSTPLHLASEKGRLEVVNLLLERGANADAEDSEGRTAFQVASAKGHEEVAKLLSEHGAK